MRPLSRQQRMDHDKAVICCICHRQHHPFDPNIPNDRKVADHDHVTGNYIWAAHDECNRKRCVVFDIPVFLYNFRGNDSHFIVTVLSSPQYRTRKIQVISQNMERYMQLKWGKTSFFENLWCSSLARSNRLYNRFAKQTSESLNISKLYWVWRIQMPISNYYIAKAFSSTSTSIRWRNSTSPRCHLARHSLSRCKERSAQWRTSITRIVSGQRSDATQLKTISSYT